MDSQSPAADRLKYSFPPELPVSAKADEIIRLWRDHQVIIVGGATGSGKTTQLPKIALALGRGRSGRIGCTQPRRLAATAMARRVSSELSVQCGNEVGYQVRFDDRTSKDTVIKFMTDGILLAETSGDRKLRQYDTLIIDEAHERSLNIDFLLGYIKDLLTVRKDLKVAISSATLDVEQFSSFFGNAPVIEVEGRMFPVEDYYLEPEDADEELSFHVARAVDFLSELDRRGDILVFLPGEREIRECTDLLAGRQLAHTEILPLYARLSNAEQQKVFQTGNRRRIILATNVAETSVTIPGIRFCIDSGMARISRYNPRTRIQELRIESISQASVRQRRGRCGRTADGVCVHLYSEDDLNRSPAYTDPEIRRTSLAGVILRMAALHLPRIDRFPFIDPPPAALIREGMRTLEDIRAILPGGKVTADGWKLAALPLDPHLGKMLLEALRQKVLPETVITASYLSIQDPRERPREKQQQADEAHRKWRDDKSDFLTILKLWNDISAQCGDTPSSGMLRRYCRQNFINYNRIREWRNLASELAENCTKEWHSPCSITGKFEDTPYDQFHKALLAGIPRQIAKYVPEYQYFLGTAGRKYVIFPGSGLFRRKGNPAWLMSFALVETARLYARGNAEIKPEYLQEVAPHLCVIQHDTPAWDERSGFVFAREKVLSGGLVLQAGRRVHYGKSNPAEARAIFIRDGLTPGRVSIPGSWVEKHSDMLMELEELELKLRRPGTVVDLEAIGEHFMEFLPDEVISTEALKKLLLRDKTDYSMNRADMMQEQYGTVNEADYPDFLTFSGHRFALRYRFEPGEKEDGCGIVVPAGEMNLLPGWALDYPPAGYLPDKLERLLRTLPRELRRQISPASEQSKDFMEQYRQGKIFTEQPLIDALSEFLNENCGTNIAPSDFGTPDLPEYLQMKLYELNEKKELKNIHREMPDRRASGSQVSRSVSGVKSFAVSGCQEWPTGDMPVEMELPGSSGKKAYPALVDEGESVGRQLFLRPAEAEAKHRAGVLRLFKLRHADQIKFIRRTFRLPREVLLAWFTADQNKDYLEELADAAILDALGTDTEDIRSQAAYDKAEKRAEQFLGEAADSKVKALCELVNSYEKVHELANRLKVRPGVDSVDLRKHLKFLFAQGFLRRPAVWSDYRRYLRGLQLRAERLNSNPAKDVEKGRQFLPWAEKFFLAANEAGILTGAPELYDFWLLTEECRLSTYAPEVPLKIRSPLSKLEAAWKDLRY